MFFSFKQKPEKEPEKIGAINVEFASLASKVVLGQQLTYQEGQILLKLYNEEIKKRKFVRIGDVDINDGLATLIKINEELRPK